MVVEIARDVLDSLSLSVNLDFDPHARQLRLEVREEIRPFPWTLLHVEYEADENAIMIGREAVAREDSLIGRIQGVERRPREALRRRDDLVEDFDVCNSGSVGTR